MPYFPIHIRTAKNHSKLCILKRDILLERKKGQLEYHDSPAGDDDISSPYHLYVTDNRNILIRDGDYFLDVDGVHIRKNSNMYSLPSDARKIIASTDGALKVLLIHYDFIRRYMDCFNNGTPIETVEINLTPESEKGNIVII